MFRKWFTFPAVRIGVVTVFVFEILMAFPSVRAAAKDFLTLFRVQQVVVLPLDSIGLEGAGGNDSFGSQLSMLISDSTIVTDEPEAPIPFTDIESASAAASFDIRLPGGMTPTSILVFDSAAFNMEVSRAKAQALLDSTGRRDLVLPEKIDGAKIFINIPSSVRIGFWTCPSEQGTGPAFDASMESGYSNCILFSQIPSPIVDVSEDLDMNLLMQIGLQFGGMTPEEAREFTSRVDLSTTLVVPIPKNSATHTSVSVDGVIGKFIQYDMDVSPKYVLLWVKNGIVYSVSGSGVDTFRAFEIANALP